MKHGKWSLAVAVLVILVSGGVALGSNMGFKFNMPFFPLGSAPNGVSRISIPYAVPYGGMGDLCTSVGLTGTAVIQQLDASNGQFSLPYLCSTGASPGPAITAGSALWVQDGNAVASGIVVGAHDPNLVLTLHCPTAGLPQGDNWMSIPYHSTSASSMEALCLEIGSSALTMQELDPNGGIFTIPYLCVGQGGNIAFDYAHTKGRSVKVRLEATDPACTGGTSINWLPNHF